MEAAQIPNWKPIHQILNTSCKGQLCLRSKEDEIEDFGKLFHFFLEWRSSLHWLFLWQFISRTMRNNENNSVFMWYRKIKNKTNLIIFKIIYTINIMIQESKVYRFLQSTMSIRWASIISLVYVSLKKIYLNGVS